MPAVRRLQHTSVPMPPDGNAAARRFYGEMLGMTEIDRPAALQHMNLVWFRAGDGGDEVHCFETTAGGPPAAQHLCLEVDDLDAYRARMAAHGVAIEETEAIFNRPRFFVRDPFGNLIELTEILGPFK